MTLEPWYRVALPREEVREGRSFNPDEFAIALEQVVAGTAPVDYRDPKAFFARTCFTRALREHAGMVLRRLAGKTANTSPVMTLVTQFGGGKTHTLTTLYHLVTAAEAVGGLDDIAELLHEAGLPAPPAARVAVFVGNAWDPQDGREAPWIDVARQLAGDRGVELLGTNAPTTPPGTEALGRVFAAAGQPVLVLFDEVLNFVNRYRQLADPFLAFIQNLTVAMTGTTHGASVISLPRSQVEMSDFDVAWQDKITKVVGRVAKNLLANDEAEVGEVVRRRLFDGVGQDRLRKKVSKAYADWCFERRSQLPPEWTLVDSAATEAKAREHLRARFEACYPFHPATLSVFQRKWQALPQFQQTRGTLAMLAQWIAWAHEDGFKRARTEPLITLGSAPLDVSDFGSVVLSQLGESRLWAAINADIAGAQGHARALDADTTGPLRDIHRRTGTTMLFESSGGQVDKVAHLPELRFALGEPAIDTTSIDAAASALEERAYFIRRVGTDGFRIGYQPTIKKVVNDRRASLDQEGEVRPAIRRLVQESFDRGASIPRIFFPGDSSAIPDTPKLSLVVMDPDVEWTGAAEDDVRRQVADWTRLRGGSPRLYPGAPIWTLRKPGRALRDKTEHWLAWKRVASEVASGTLGSELDSTDRAEITAKVREAADAAREDVWGDYRFVVIAEAAAADGLKSIDLGTGHSSSADSLCGRVVAALKSSALLNDSIGPGYIERNWPPALKESGAWPLVSLRQSFLDGSLTRLVDPDTVLRGRIVEWVAKGDFGLGSGQDSAGRPERAWFEEDVQAADVMFNGGVYLLTRDKAKALKRPASPEPEATAGSADDEAARTDGSTTTGSQAQTPPGPQLTGGSEKSVKSTLCVHGNIPAETWNRVGTKLLPKLRSATAEKLEISVTVNLTTEATDGSRADALLSDLRQILDDLQLADRVQVTAERS